MSKGNQELKVIINGCVRNSEKHQQKLFRMFYGKMYAVCLRYIKDEDVAKDVVQDGFIKVFDKIGKYNHQGSFEGWMRRLIVNTAIDFLRKQKNHFVAMDNDAVMKDVDDQLNIEEGVDEELLQIKAELAMEAVQELSPAYRTVFNMYVIENYSHREIAEILDISEGTSKSNLAKAKQNLRKILEEKLSKKL